jgi:DNA-binding MarR family transcriptional regulator
MASFRERPLYLTHVAHQQMKKVLASRIKPTGLTPTDCIVLEAIQEEPGISGVELATACGVTKQALAQILDKLEQRRLVVRRSTPGLGRTLRSYLSDEGARVAAVVTTTVDELQDEAIGHLSSQDAAQLREVLRANLEAWSKVGGNGESST